MAYDKHTWTCDEPITVERLNHIEDGIANAGGGDCGFECEETRTLLTEETVTTAVDPEIPDGVAYAYLAYSQLIDAESKSNFQRHRIRMPSKCNASGL